MKKSNTMKYKLLLFIFATFQSCSVTNKSGDIVDIKAYPRIIEQSKKDNRYLVMHSGVDTFSITSLLIEKEKKEFTVQLNKLDSALRAKIKNPAGSSRRVTHFYMKDSTSYTLDEPHTIPFSRVGRIELAN